MFIRHLGLYNYRNYARLELDLSARIHLFVGDNAQGKTNLLEAVYYLATTRSPLAGQDRELIRWESGEQDVIPNAQLALTYVRRAQEHTLEASLVKEPVELGYLDDVVFRRQLRHDGANRRAMDIVGKLNVVMFLPEDILLISGSPGERRRYLDIFLCQLDAHYCRSLSAYNRVLTQRNALLRRIREGAARPGELSYWDDQLTRRGGYVMARRLWAATRLEPHVCDLQAALTGGREELRLEYVHTLADAEAVEGARQRLDDPELHWSGEEPGGDVARILQHQLGACLRDVQRDEILRGMTVLGPHRDDLRFMLNGHDARVYGSRGQQRTVALAVKLAEVALMHENVGEMPVLLLDDVLSELDQQRGRLLLEHIAGAEQVLVTTTSLSDIPPDVVEAAQVWCVQAGSVAPLQATQDCEGL
jgi:DNA replication and repair protein RecF